jgi:hypothetical protein
MIVFRYSTVQHVFAFVACLLTLATTSQTARADLITGGSATFTFDQALYGVASPINNLTDVFKGTQSRTDCLNGTGSDPFDSVVGTEKTITFLINSGTPASITGRPNNAATTLNYDVANPLTSWGAGLDSGAFLALGTGEQIGLQSMTRWTGDFTGVLLFGDFAIRNAPGRIGGGRSGLVLVSNIDFPNATFADLANINISATATSLNISGDLLYSNGFGLLTGGVGVGEKFGTFQINALTAVPEPGAVLLVSMVSSLVLLPRKRTKRC